MAIVALLFGPGADLLASATDRPFRLAFTLNIFQKSNENDVRAAMKVWIMTLAEEQGVLADPDPHIHRTLEDLMQFARANPVDAFGVTTPEYVSLSREFSFDLFAPTAIKGEIEDVYLLLVRQESQLERLDQLAGSSLNVADHPRMSLAVIWLDTVLVEAKLRRTSDFFGKVTLAEKVSQVVLPVFFGKVDACLVTQESFEVMGDLNPQLKRQLRVLSSSPPFVPGGIAFRRDSPSPYRQQAVEALSKLKDSPAGRQILEFTQSEALDVRNISCLDESLALLKKHQQLLGGD